MQPGTSVSSSAGSPKPALHRSLGLWELVIMGIILVQPTAPMSIYGAVQQEARGHVVTAVLVAMVAMMFTAFSYGRMAAVYPSAGSAYTYVGQEIHPALGYATGWSMLLDYVINPLICTIWCSKAAMNILPMIPYAVWALFFAGLFTWMNLRKIETSARMNAALAVVMLIVVAAVLAAAVKFLMGESRVDYLRPFYDPATFKFSTVATGTSVAVLTYIGFDGISTLSEEVKDPKRNILYATVLICLIIGVLSSIEVYAAQLVWPASIPFPDVDTAYVHVAGKIGGVVLFQAVNLTLLVANIGSGAGGQLAGARLLYGMGRDNALPRGFFGRLDPKTLIPSYNVMTIGVLCAIGAFILSFQLGAELLNFGAFIGFMGVNMAAFLHYWVRGKRTIWTFLPPLLGFVICFAIWLSLRPLAQITGGVWLAFGMIYGAWRTKGFRQSVRFDAVE